MWYHDVLVHVKCEHYIYQNIKSKTFHIVGKKEQCQRSASIITVIILQSKKNATSQT